MQRTDVTARHREIRRKILETLAPKSNFGATSSEATILGFFNYSSTVFFGLALGVITDWAAIMDYGSRMRIVLVCFAYMGLMAMITTQDDTEEARDHAIVLGS
jgi:hypothetical protein